MPIISAARRRGGIPRGRARAAGPPAPRGGTAGVRDIICETAYLQYHSDTTYWDTK